MDFHDYEKERTYDFPLFRAHLILLDSSLTAQPTDLLSQTLSVLRWHGNPHFHLGFLDWERRGLHERLDTLQSLP